MKPKLGGTLAVLFIIASILTQFALGAFYSQKRKGSIRSSGISAYVDHDLGYSIESSPRGYRANRVSPNSVTFSDKDGGPWAYSVRKEPTTFTSSEEWLAAQPKGSATTVGFEPILQIGKDTLFVAEYVIVDSDGRGGNLAYGKLLEMVHV
jgi:hypothetical protein